MTVYNTIIIGGGSSGLLSAIHLDDKKSIMLEKNDTLGKKSLLLVADDATLPIITVWKIM